ncbi:SIP domain-containing protein [Shigella flexneri]
MAGPRGRPAVPEDYAYQLYVCDESGTPALRRRLEMLSKLAVKPQVSAEVSQRRRGLSRAPSTVLFDGLAHDEQAVDARLAQMQIPADDYFIWITGEGKNA